MPSPVVATRLERVELAAEVVRVETRVPADGAMVGWIEPSRTQRCSVRNAMPSSLAASPVDSGRSDGGTFADVRELSMLFECMWRVWSRLLPNDADPCRMATEGVT